MDLLEGFWATNVPVRDPMHGQWTSPDIKQTIMTSSNHERPTPTFAHRPSTVCVQDRKIYVTSTS